MEQNVTAILKYWCLHFSPLTLEQRQVFESQRSGLLAGVVIGQVVMDSMRRCDPGPRMRSSLIATYDFQAGLVYTETSCYQLSGIGMHAAIRRSSVVRVAL